MLVPPDDRVLLREVEPESRTAFGLELPETAQQPSSRAIVLAVGKGRRFADGSWLPHGEHVRPGGFQFLAPGDEVVLPKYGGTEIEGEDGSTVISILASEILAVVVVA